MTATFPPTLAIHGGAGTLRRADMDAAQERCYLTALHDILQTAHKLLTSGGTALDVVTLAVHLLEDCPLFNAGYGAVFTTDATHELDAALMDGRTLHAGAVAGVRHIRNPIRAARVVLEQGRHVLMAGLGAESLARAAGLVMVEADYFSTPERLAQLHAAQQQQRGAVLDHDGAAAVHHKMGTVGAVALDRAGNLAAATSTGGMTNKCPGRIGDSPLIGAGTYADNRSAAVSCTGHGEAFIRSSAAHDVCARMAYGGLNLQQAAHALIHQALPAIDGSGGLIALDRSGQVAMPFNTEGMYRGFARAGQAPQAFIFKQETTQ